MDGLKIGTLICCFISLVLLVIALATPNWVEAADYAGLWRGCNYTVCYSFGMQVASYVHATRALLIIGLIFGIVSFIDLCASFCHTYFGSSTWTKVTSKASFFAGLAVLAAMGAFTGGYFVSSILVATQLGWSYGLGWAPGLLFLVIDGLIRRIHTRHTRQPV
ncbi:lens fiber membrane intrinsic protein-like [Eublepharis macularius]|uniref:Lens fiber membrane intrinsic protein-like n=1 Tax=Eublepharis macularius TaxID=481883 RepID=A0AA97LL19_EUBMA|nr:lens fiber membrane intrinsic protein-like [Eublepharis macularius]